MDPDKLALLLPLRLDFKLDNNKEAGVEGDATAASKPPSPLGVGLMGTL